MADSICFKDKLVDLSIYRNDLKQCLEEQIIMQKDLAKESLYSFNAHINSLF